MLLSISSDTLLYKTEINITYDLAWHFVF